LEATGFLTTQKKKGIVVNRPTKEALKEITTIRLTLESLAAELACKTPTQETLNRLEALMEVYTHTKDPEELLRVNKEFHHTIYRDANMPLLQQIIIGLWDRVSPYLSLFVYSFENWESGRKDSLKCHQGMLENMRRKDSKQMPKWVKADLTRLPPSILDFLEHKEKMD